MKLGDIAWYIRDSRVHSATIWSVCVVENSHDDWCHNEKQKETWQPFGPSGTYYATCHGMVKQDEAFDSKEALLASL